MRRLLAGIMVCWFAFCGFATADDLPKFKKIQLSDKYYSEGASYGDFNQDGKLDLVSGPYWFEGPDFKNKHKFYDGKEYPNDRGYSDNFFSFVGDFNGDGWDDVLVVGLPGTPAHWYKNSQGEGEWKKHLAFPIVDNEAPTFADITGDGNRELVFHYEGRLGYAKPNHESPDEPWLFTAISEKGPWQRFTHGLGIGDVNGNGRMDFLMPTGWWEHPESGGDDEAVWKHHAARFCPGGATIHAVDLNGNGKNDIVTSLRGHGYGLVWHEQQGEGDEVRFTEHLIMGEKPEENEHRVAFSQLHAVEMADIDGDGIEDIITGKCYWAHNGNDPGARDPAVVYVFLTRRDGEKVSFQPVQVDDNSGTGRQVTIADINGDGKLDIMTGNKKGIFLFVQE